MDQEPLPNALKVFDVQVQLHVRARSQKDALSKVLGALEPEGISAANGKAAARYCMHGAVREEPRI